MMHQERYVLYESATDYTGERGDDIGGAWTPERAIAKAQKHADRTGRIVVIDWQLEEVTRDGREILDTDADLYEVKPAGYERSR
jgi:hypothetical protein